MCPFLFCSPIPFLWSAWHHGASLVIAFFSFPFLSLLFLIREVGWATWVRSLLVVWTIFFFSLFCIGYLFRLSIHAMHGFEERKPLPCPCHRVSMYWSQGGKQVSFASPSSHRVWPSWPSREENVWHISCWHKKGSNKRIVTSFKRWVEK